jgi:hypothetical protein
MVMTVMMAAGAAEAEAAAEAAEAEAAAEAAEAAALRRADARCVHAPPSRAALRSHFVGTRARSLALLAC